MKNRQMKTILFILIICLSATGRANDGEQLFNKTCFACHSIGKGRLVGPDLLNITDKRSQEWLISFIKSSTSLIKSGDPEANAIFKEYNNLLMPDNAYSDAQIVSILEYISQGGANDSGQGNAAEVDILSGTTADNVNAGLRIFSGRQQLTNGGAACSACHKVSDERIFSSGTLAKDLSESHDVMGSAGMAAIIRSSPFPVMQVAYKEHALTEEEVINLTAYLKSVSKERIYQRPRYFGDIFALLGIMAFCLIFLSTIILYYKRKKNPVNQELLDRPSRVIN